MTNPIKVLLISLTLLFLPVTSEATANQAVVVIEYDHQPQGMGWVIDNNLIITAAHVLRDESEIFHSTVTVDFGRGFKIRRRGIVGDIDLSRDLAFIHVSTANFVPIKLANQVAVNSYTYWNIPGDENHFFQFERVAGRVYKKVPVFSAYSPKTNKDLIYFETGSESHLNRELFVILGHNSEYGSSGGLVTNDAGEAVGIMVMLVLSYGPYHNVAGMVSIDGIKRLLLEDREQIYDKKFYKRNGHHFSYQHKARDKN